MDNLKVMGDRISNRITRQYLESLVLEMRVIDTEEPSTEFELFGEKFATPVMTAALSHLEGICRDGMVEMARGAAAAGALVWAGLGSDEELEKMIGTGAKVVKIIKPYEDPEEVLREIRHAESCGALAVGMDVDHPFARNGKYMTLEGHKMAAKSLEDMKGFVRESKLPFIVKGVLSVQDARKCAEMGAAGMIVSHHNAIIDYAAPPLMVLPEILKAVGGTMPVFVDCCLESGADVYKAMALGASAAGVGRALMGPLGEKGADGVKAKIQKITADLAYLMGMTGCQDVSHFDASVVRYLENRMV